jgi:acyl-CoA reductase-like NAD-dependent aldehyde dehydrogenase
MLDIGKLKTECFGKYHDWFRQRLPLAKYFAGNEWIAGRRSVCFVRNPANNQKVGCVRDATIDEPMLSAANRAARQAQDKWRWVSVEAKRNFYGLLADTIRDSRYDLIMLMATESGKTTAECIEEVAKTVEMMRGNLDNRRLYGAKIVLAMTPYNLSLLFPAIKIMSALKNNCAVILKPSSKTPFTAVYLTWIIHRCLKRTFGDQIGDSLCGLVQTIPGQGRTVGRELVEELAYDLLDFTGSTTAGEIVGNIAKSRGASYRLGPGGHSRMIVMPDFDIGKAADEIAAAWLRTSGQRSFARADPKYSRRVTSESGHYSRPSGQPDSG